MPSPPQQQQQHQLPPFDLDSYIARYDPHSETQLQRLLFLAHSFHNLPTASNNDSSAIRISQPLDLANADTNTNTNITRQALDYATSKMKESGNHRRYQEEFGAIVVEQQQSATNNNAGGGDIAIIDGEDSSTPELTGTPIRTSRDSNSAAAAAASSTSPSAAGGVHAPKQQQQQNKHIIQHYQNYDANFISSSKYTSQERCKMLEGRLESAKSHLMKDSIRTALLALAEFHRERGELREAWRRVARSREYCASGQQHTQVCLLLIELSVDLREWSSVRDTISRAEHTVMGDIDDPLFHQKLRAAHGVAHLAEGRYLEAAKSFTSVSPELTNQFNSVISAEDLAMYGALLGLATLDRGTLHSLVIDGVFKGRLELVPTMREALRHYSRAEYGQCLALLQHSIKRDLLLDIHLHAHVPILLDMIRDRCIVQYFQPYSSVSLEKMGHVFGYDNVDEIEEVVAKLISNGGVDGMPLGNGRARINALDKTLSVEGPRSLERKARRQARVRAAKMGVQFARNAEGMILRVGCLENGIAVQSDKRAGWRGRGGRSRDRDRRGGGDTRDHPADRMMMGGPTDPYESDESVISDDAMDIDNHIVNPNEF